MLSDYINADQRFVTCTNKDTVYGAGFGSHCDFPTRPQLS
jgi:hypothetical protein